MFAATEGTQSEGPQTRAVHRERLRARPTAELEDTYRQLDALEAAVRAERMEIVAALDERSVGREDGSVDTAAWVADTSRVTRPEARRLVDTAAALQQLPAIRAAAAAGTLSWDQLTAVCRFATPETDEEWARRAPGWTPAQLNRQARAQRAVTEAEACTRYAERSFTWNWDQNRMLKFRGQLPDVEGAAMVEVFERYAAPVQQDAEGNYLPFPVRCADVFVDLVSQPLDPEAEPVRACVVAQVPAAALAEGSTEPGAQLSGGEVAIANETARRLACDCIWQPMLEAADGSTIAAARQTQSVPTAMRRKVRHRDRHCQFPGCDRTRALHIHHMIHRADGGPTELWNLVLLCPFHHRFVHEHGWRITGDTAVPGGLEFRAPDGRRLGGPRPPLRAEVHDRILEPA